ncbi:MAG: hypothetical protein MUC50_01645 [Myxococcota bacterium]|nr:hypothetical protein [Myxococcota bacterium]
MPADCPEAPSDPVAAKALAGTWFGMGEAFVRNEAYDQALDAFRCSLRLFEHSSTAYNAALAAQQVGELRLALQLARTCLELDDKKPQRVKDLIVTLVQLIEEPADPAEASQAPVAPIAVVEPVHETTAQAAQGKRANSKSPLLLAGYLTLGLGVASLITAAITGGVALSIDSELSKKCAKDHCSASEANRIETMNSLATSSTVLLAVGGAAAASGVLMLALGYRRRKAEKSELNVSPIAGPALVGAMLSGRF